MALDGIFLRHIKSELEKVLTDSRVSQVYQPNRDELIINLRTFDGNKRLLISARADSPRLGITEYSVENPDKPPMFCMLLRKRLTGAKLVKIRQPQLERILFFDFDAVNELGDKVRLTLAAEIMGKHSNVVLYDEKEIIIDALKRVDITLSSKRLVLPSLAYEMPPSQNKVSLEAESSREILNLIKEKGEARLDKAILNTLTGVSPVVCRELSYIATGVTDAEINLMTEKQWLKLENAIVALCAETENPGSYAITLEMHGKLFDFSFMPITQYGNEVKRQEYKSFCQALDGFYHTRESYERMRVKSHALNKLIGNNIERLSRKISAQRLELEKCSGRESFRQMGDLIAANMHLIKKGAAFAEVVNFYDENSGYIRIPLDAAKSPQQNAQKYYKDYAKAKTADKMLRVQIEKSLEELSYMETVADEISRAENEQDLTAIRFELVSQGYLKENKSEKNNRKHQKQKADFRRFETSDGFEVLVGRNNSQNDLLTLKTAEKSDLWFHTKDIPGSHTVIITHGKEVSEQAIVEAAQLAAYFSKAKESSKVAVDYTLIKKVSKPVGAKPGKVIYTNHRTLYVTPSLISK